MQINLSNGGVALIDEQDAPRISPHRWYRVEVTGGKVYARTRIGGRHVYLHRHIMQPGRFDVDHLDGDGLNNQRGNLIVSTRANNIRNSVRADTGRSRFKGVSASKNGNRWCAKIKLQGRQVHLGTFDTEAEAARAYDTAAEDASGAQAWLNRDNHPDL